MKTRNQNKIHLPVVLVEEGDVEDEVVGEDVVV
jgi:hypothetical protein